MNFAIWVALAPSRKLGSMAQILSQTCLEQYKLVRLEVCFLGYL